MLAQELKVAGVPAAGAITAPDGNENLWQNI